MPLILGTNSIKDTGYNVANSCRFNHGSTDNLSKSFSASNRRTFTFSAWIKRGFKASNMSLFSGRSDGSNYGTIRIESNGKFHIFDIATSFSYQVKTNAQLRDNSAWYHLVVAFDSTQGTASNRIKMYVNGQQETDLAESSYPSENYQSFFNNNLTHYVGLGGNLGDAYDGYMAEVCFIDGTALDPTSFGEFDEDSPTIWKPKDVSGLTFGTNGFYLDFENSSSLGADVSGNSNNFTVNNLTSIDQSIDTCTNNFATANPLNYSPSTNFSSSSEAFEGMLRFKQIAGVSSDRRWVSTIGVTTGKWYFEVNCTAGITNAHVGVSDQAQYRSFGDDYVGKLSSDVGYNLSGGNVKVNNSNVDTGEDTFSTSDTICVALDVTNSKIYFRKNGTSWVNSGNPSSGSNGYSLVSGATIHPSGSIQINNGIMLINFGSPPFSISSGNSDAEGFGNFEFEVPSGYFALCTKNLSEYG